MIFEYLPKKGSRKASNWWYLQDVIFRKFRNFQKLVMMMIGFASKFTLVIFKLIAVIDCASKMMMNCARGGRVILLPSDLLKHLFISSKNNRSFFVGFCFFFSHSSHILNKKLILFYFRFWFCCVVFNRVWNIQKSFQEIICLCTFGCRLVICW